MASLRPEGALNSAKGLVELGRIDDALDALHLVLSNRRYRQWNATMEKIAEEYVKLCLATGRPRYAKDGLIQFRNICQPNNLQSLDGILKQFRALAEEKVRQTRGKLTTGADGLIDLEEAESGESLLLSALSPDGAVADERAARSALRDLWDTLRTILEVCRNHPALDETYHATAVMAFDFCSEFKRRNEFRRICETLRLHQQQASFKTTSSSSILGGLGGQQTSVDPLTRVIDTRTYQMKVASELGLWSTAFHTAEELFALLSKKRPSQSQLITYYSNLAKILLMSTNSQQNQLFHAACVLKHAALNLSSEAADEAVLAVLSTRSAGDFAIQISADTQTADEFTTDFNAEKAARLTTLTGSGNVPTCETLLSDLIAKDLVSHASDSVKQIYAMLTDSKVSSKTLNEKLPLLLKQLPQAEQLACYRPSLVRVALVKVTRDLQSMFSCIRFDKFQALTGGLLQLEESIKLLGQLKRTDQIDVVVDFKAKTISFGASSPSASSSGALDVLTQSASLVRSYRSSNRIAEKAAALLFDEEAFFNRLEKERKRCEERRNASDSRKDAIEHENIKKAQELADQLKRAEEERLEADARVRAAEVARRETEAKKRAEILTKAKVLIDKIIATGGAAEVSNLNDDAIVELGIDKLDQILKNQVAKERLERINKRRNESRRLEHTARLLRLAGNEKISQWAESIYAKDKAVFSQMAQEKAEEWKKAAEAKRASINALTPFANLLGKWKATKVEEFNHKLALRAEERRLKSSKLHSRQVSDDSEAMESDVAPTSTLSRDEFKEMARSLPSWKDPSPVDPSD